MKKCIGIIILLLGSCGIGLFVKKITDHYKSAIEFERDSKSKNWNYYNLSMRWLNNKMNACQISDVLIEYGIRRVVIYGAGPMGEALCEELKGSNVQVLCCIDKSPEKQGIVLSDYCTIKTMEEVAAQLDIDAYVVTAVHYFDEICNELEQQGISYDKIISLEDVVYSA